MERRVRFLSLLLLVQLLTSCCLIVSVTSEDPLSLDDSTSEEGLEEEEQEGEVDERRVWEVDLGEVEMEEEGAGDDGVLKAWSEDDVSDNDEQPSDAIDDYEICEPVRCRMFCPAGFALDEDGCEMCECNPEEVVDPPTDQVAPAVPCPLVACPDPCLLGYELDQSGCQSCTCKTAPAAIPCPLVACPDPCPLGYELDQSGCQSCTCKTAPALAACSQVACPDPCPLGYELDQSGCQSCTCKTAPASRGLAPCPLVACADSCPQGYRLDDSGCQSCACIEPSAACRESEDGPWCPDMDCGDGVMRLDQDGCPLCECADRACPPVMCAMFCEYGFVDDENGCPLCQCKPNPCESSGCSSEERCELSVGDDGQTTATCQPVGRPWCSPAQCMMFCVHGFVTDTLGCQLCACRQTPPTSCPEQQEQCATDDGCLFGRAYDENLCATCNCLPDPCLTKTCDDEHQICKTQAHRGCDSSCPVTAICKDSPSSLIKFMTHPETYETLIVACLAVVGCMVLLSLACVIITVCSRRRRRSRSTIDAESKSSIPYTHIDDDDAYVARNTKW